MPPLAPHSDSGRLAFVDPGENCLNTGTQHNLMSSILQSMDMSKLDNVFSDVRRLNTHATNRDYTIEVVGEFGVGVSCCTPFGAFPMQFPDYAGAKMADILISDFTINSLFFHLQSVDFLRIRMGPKTPKYGELMKTTCSLEEDTGLEDHGVGMEDGSETVLAKRQDAGDLTSLGVCLGDILLAVREQYPNQLVYVIIHTIRASSIILSSQNGGVALLNFPVDVDFYIHSTNQRSGTIRIALDVRITIRTNISKRTRINIFRHKMWDTSVMAWATHNALRVVWYCQRCNQRYPETFEFSSSGKSRRFGAYQHHQGKKERLEVNIHWDDVRYEYLKIRGDAADYSLILFNCKAWATLFCKNISKRTRINTNECACDTWDHIHATAIEIYQNVNEEEIYEQTAPLFYVCTLYIWCRNCQRNAMVSFVYKEHVGKGFRWGKYALRRSLQQFHKLDNIDMGRILTIFEGMDDDGRYHLIYYNSSHWTRDFYRKDDSIAMPLVFDRPLQPQISLAPNSLPAYFMLPANVPLERPIYDQNDNAIEDELAEEAKAKPAQTFVRFGKKAQTFVRFGKRAQTFVRFGRDAQRQQQMANEQQKQAQKKE